MSSVKPLLTNQSPSSESGAGRAAGLARLSASVPAAPQLIGAVLAAFGVLAALSTEDGPVLCPIRRCTGGYCPACGMTRSGGRLLRGDLGGAWQQHPYLFVLLPQVLIGGAALALGLVRRFKFDRERLLRRLLLVNGVIMIAIWVVRLVGGSIPFPFLS